MKMKAKSISGIELNIDILNQHESSKSNWIILLDGKKIKMNKDGKSFSSPAHGQDFYLVD